MKLRLMLLCLASPAFAAAPTTNTELPAGVVYAPADAATIEKASQRLREALTQGPAALAALFGLADSDARLMVGPYFGIEMNGDNLEGKALLPTGKYSFPIPGTAGLIAESFAGTNAREKRFLAHYVFLAGDFSGKLDIREPTYDEMALIWAWISWDLDGPLLIAESATDKYAFDFDPKTGLITWVERLTRPCTTGQQEGKEVFSCSCARVNRKGASWRVDFEPLESCPEYSLPRSATSARKLPPVYLRSDPRTRRVDLLLARQYASEYSIVDIEDGLPGYRGPGKKLAGESPAAPMVDGKPLRGYVLMGSVIGDDGRAYANRILISTDDRLSAAALLAADTWRIEPATRDGKPVSEMIWQELPFE